MHHLLKTYQSLVSFLATALGDNVEIALHDLTKEEAPIIAIANNEMSGRMIGDSLTDLGQHILKQKQYERKDFVMNYKSLTDSGKLVRAASYFIKDEKKHLIGMLCINVNISDYDYLQKALQRILGIKEQPEIEYQMDHPIEILPNSLEASIKQCVLDTLKELGYPDYVAKGRLKAKEKASVIKILHDKGVFNMKGAISLVAKELSASEPTIYRYLKNI